MHARCVILAALAAAAVCGCFGLVFSKSAVSAA